MQRMSITIDDDLKRDLDNIAPKGERAAFVSNAIAKEIEAQKKHEAVEMLKNFKRFKVKESSVELVRKVRQDRVDYVANRHQCDDQ